MFIHYGLGAQSVPFSPRKPWRGVCADFYARCLLDILIDILHLAGEPESSNVFLTVFCLHIELTAEHIDNSAADGQCKKNENTKKNQNFFVSLPPIWQKG